MEKLPEGWVESKLEDLGAASSVIMGQSPSSSWINWKEGKGLPFLQG
jgi:hypothetical protein